MSLPLKRAAPSSGRLLNSVGFVRTPNQPGSSIVRSALGNLLVTSHQRRKAEISPLFPSLARSAVTLSPSRGRSTTPMVLHRLVSDLSQPDSSIPGWPRVSLRRPMSPATSAESRSCSVARFPLQAVADVCCAKRHHPPASSRQPESYPTSPSHHSRICRARVVDQTGRKLHLTLWPSRLAPGSQARNGAQASRCSLMIIPNRPDIRHSQSPVVEGANRPLQPDPSETFRQAHLPSASFIYKAIKTSWFRSNASIISW